MVKYTGYKCDYFQLKIKQTRILRSCCLGSHRGVVDTHLQQKKKISLLVGTQMSSFPQKVKFIEKN